MKKIVLPEREMWKTLCRRPEIEKEEMEDTIKDILSRVRKEKDKAVRYYSGLFDGIEVDSIRVTEAESEKAARSVPDKLRAAIEMAKKNIEMFHRAQTCDDPVVEPVDGVRCWRKSVPIEKTGLYIPGGTAPLFSTVLMLAIPATIAGCKDIILCTPPGKDGNIDPLILYAARVTGVTEVFRAGGAQAIAAMAYGTETIPAVDKIFGPGNQYVTRAKEMVMQDGIAIDMPAGPSEVLVVADRGADPVFIAADLISQAEHGDDSQVIMVTDNREIMEATEKEVNSQLLSLPRRDTAINALKNSMLILLPSLGECFEFSNLYAPEHLIINTDKAASYAEKIINAGSVFLGPYSCESAGDYATGTNHTLPTKGYSRSYSGVSVESFQKKISFQEVEEKGILTLGPAIEQMAEAEMLYGHMKAVEVRITNIGNGRY
jgi:histidinol dehydrogenase